MNSNTTNFKVKPLTREVQQDQLQSKSFNTSGTNKRVETKLYIAMGKSAWIIARLPSKLKPNLVDEVKTGLNLEASPRAVT